MDLPYKATDSSLANRSYPTATTTIPISGVSIANVEIVTYVQIPSSLAGSPSAPLNLEPIGYTDSSITIRWEAPYENGGRSDLYYQVHHSDPVIPGLMIEANCTRNEECLTDTVCTITGLQPATTYFVRVSAHNGVSDQDEGGALTRIIDITLETDVAREIV